MTTHNHVTHSKHGRVRIPRRAEGMLEDAQTRLERLSLNARERGMALLESVRDRSEEMYGQAKDQSLRAVEGAKDWVSENPAQAAGIAFVAGVLFHRWISSRKSED